MAAASGSRRSRTARVKKTTETVRVAASANERDSPAPGTNQQLAEGRIPGSGFSLELVLLVLRMVIEGAISMRAAARISGLICQFIGGHRLDGLSHTTVQNYLLRIGLDQIEHRCEVHADLIWIMDHMIAAGSLKCFVVLGVPADLLAKLDRPLEHRDVDVLALIPTEVSNGAVVHDQLQELAQRRGVPRAILSDCGSDLKKGVELFRRAHPETIALYDIVHLTCRLIWKRLEKEDRFSQYRQACCRCANKLRQSPLAHLKPPRPKTKARYMNLEPEIRWGRRALWLLDRVRRGGLTDRQKKRLNKEDVESQLNWLEEYRAELETWSELSAVGQTSCSVVRRHGYGEATVAALKSSLGSGTTPAAQELIAELVALVQKQCDLCSGNPGNLPGSSEVLESLIGRAKRLLGTSQNNNSLTGQILALAASTVRWSAGTLLESLQRCRIGHVKDWIKKNIRPGIHTARREDLASQANGINVAQVQIATTPNF